MILFLLACASPPVSAPPVAAEVEDTAPPSTWTPDFQGAPLDALALLRRASLDLRGVVPTEAELDEVEADPKAVDGLVEAMLDDPRYEERLVDLFGQRLLTRVDEFNVASQNVGLELEDQYLFLRSVGEEPLRLMASVATQDLPWTTIVTTDTTVANDTLASFWPLEMDPGEGWRPARYTDGRPPGGVVMSNGLWWRYTTTPNNYNRSRAAALSRLFLCEDFLTRPIEFEAVAILDREDLNEAIRTIPACVGCHATLDPLAASLFGFWWFDIYTPVELESYHPEREFMGDYYLETSMAFFGAELDDPSGLGPAVANDPRFRSCAVETMAEALWQRQTDFEDFTTLTALQDVFEEGDLRMRPLVAAILAGEDYRVGELLPDAPEEEEGRLTTRRILSPEQLERAVADLTGYTWTYAGYDQLTNDVSGYRIMAGGMDGLEVTQPSRNPSLTAALVMKRLSQAAATEVVNADFNAEPADRRLLGPIDLILPNEEVLAEEITRLHRRILGQAPGSEELQDEVDLWQTIELDHGSAQAWTSLLSVLLRDPAFWIY